MMEGKLKIVKFEDVNPRRKYFVFYKDEIHQVEDLKKNKVKLVHLKTPVNRDQVTPVKLKVKVDKMLCDLLFDDYKKIIGDLEEDMILQGTITKFKQKASEGDTIVITSLHIIDKYGFYDHNVRYGTVHSIEPTHHIVLMNKDNVEVRCKRTDYKIVNVHDEQKIFHLPCECCGK